MPTLLKIKRRHIDNTEPTTADIAEGELAVNTVSHLLFCRDDDDNVFPIGGVPKGSTDGTILTWNEITQRWEETNIDDVIFTGGVPDGTVDGNILIWNNTTGEWEESNLGGVPDGTVDGTILVWNNTTMQWEEANLSGLVLRPSVVTDATTARTLTAADENAIILFTSGSAVTVTLPTDAEDGDIEIGFLCHLHQEGAGQVTASSTGTVRYAVGPSTYEQYSSISVMKIASDTWKIVGDQTS